MGLLIVFLAFQIELLEKESEEKVSASVLHPLPNN